MVTDRETNQVYFSELLATDGRYRDAWRSITAALDKHGVRYGLLKGTKDIWCRDYMPVQQSADSFIQFRYEPSYLSAHPHLKTDPAHVLQVYGLRAQHSDINLDGGNVLRWTDRVILTDRVFEENPALTKARLHDQLENLFEAEVIIIPAIRSDMTGHADGLVRFYDRQTLICNRMADEYQYWQRGMRKVISQYGFDYVELPLFEYKEKQYPLSAIGCYVNYLEIGDLILVPVFDVPGNKDQEAIDTLAQVFSNRTIETVNINAVARQGGLLNCVTWNVLDDKV
ncbi:agmatine deiminase family protein [Pontibacter kalidii]|uniref:agmatine deiminase family protein n=1 Tax=Pontibacter kalidii TaxID=2592049 RepID=UPI002255AF6F|nr:agmatine deiminase family protein [Pontibacter kalidii]